MSLFPEDPSSFFTAPKSEVRIEQWIESTLSGTTQITISFILLHVTDARCKTALIKRCCGANGGFLGKNYVSMIMRSWSALNYHDLNCIRGRKMQAQPRPLCAHENTAKWWDRQKAAAVAFRKKPQFGITAWKYQARRGSWRGDNEIRKLPGDDQVPRASRQDLSGSTRDVRYLRIASVINRRCWGEKRGNTRNPGHVGNAPREGCKRTRAKTETR